jgi:hypothetical protein
MMVACHLVFMMVACHLVFMMVACHLVFMMVACRLVFMTVACHLVLMMVACRLVYMMVACRLVFMMVACRLPSCTHCALPIQEPSCLSSIPRLGVHRLRVHYNRVDRKFANAKNATEDGHLIDILPVSLPYRSKMDAYRNFEKHTQKG